MQSVAEKLASLPANERAAAISQLSSDEAEALLHDWRGFLARPNQVAPDGDWSVWLLLAGRGFGKTRCGSEFIREEVTAGRARRIALVAETAADARDVMVEGDSGILGIYPEEERPLYEPSKRRLTWDNGAVATLYNATEPDQLRGPQHDLAWCDELAKWRYCRETWDQLMFGLRLGRHPRVVVTTTPRPIDLVRELVARCNRDDGVAVTRGRTLDNSANLAGSFLKQIEDKYSGTRLGRQELEAEILDDAPGALWTRRNLDEWRKAEADLPELKRILVSVDPAVTATEDSDEHGIIVVAEGHDNRGYVLEDATVMGSPDMWARRAVAMHDKYGADGIVVEVNQGGDMVKSTLKSVRSNLNVIEVRASRGKHVRAEPIAALYEQGKVSHVGSFPQLEDQMVLMTAAGFEGETSPDRVDALVWAMSKMFPSIIAEPVTTDYFKKKGRAKAGTWMGA